jgi:hypothetical protein
MTQRKRGDLRVPAEQDVVGSDKERRSSILANTLPMS